MAVPVALTIRERVVFAAKLKRVRKILGITQMDAARFMGVSVKTIRNLEVARHGPSSSVYLAFRKLEKQSLTEKDYLSVKRVPR